MLNPAGLNLAKHETASIGPKDAGWDSFDLA